MGAQEQIETAYSVKRKCPEFAKYSEKVKGIRKVVNTYLLVRLQDY